MSDTWDPTTYDRHADQRSRPALDLLALVRPQPGSHTVDLGCGTGRFTRMLHDQLGAESTVGIDTSPAMLADAASHATEGLTFATGDIRTFDEPVDVVFANASLQWLDDSQEAVLRRLCRSLRPNGQLAVQVPANFGHPSHTVADALGQEFGLEPQARVIAALTLPEYATILHTEGLVDLDVSMRIYGNAMARTTDVIDWVSGTLLTTYRRQLGEERFADFLSEYRTRLLATLGDPGGDAPYYYTFPRILAYGRKPQ